MTKETFIKILEDNDIIWNDVVEVVVFNPNYKWWQFGKPRLLTFVGALGTIENTFISICTDNGLKNDNWFEIHYLFFDYDQIVSVKKIK